jgi:hypothetical protein
MIWKKKIPAIHKNHTTFRSDNELPMDSTTPHPYLEYEFRPLMGLLNISTIWPFHQHMNDRDPLEENEGVFKTCPELG